MVTELKKERMQMMKEIYEGRGEIKYLKNKFGEEKYNDFEDFLYNQKLLEAKKSEVCKEPGIFGIDPVE